MIGRRGFITGLISLVAAPAIVRAGSLMPVKAIVEPYGVGPMMHGMITLEEYARVMFADQRRFRAEWWKMVNEANALIDEIPVLPYQPEIATRPLTVDDAAVYPRL
jgi:hypothetical protein